MSIKRVPSTEVVFADDEENFSLVLAKKPCLMMPKNDINMSSKPSNSSISTENRFAPLMQNKNQNSIQNTSSVFTHRKQKIVIPPIVVTNKSFTQIKDLMQHLKINIYNIQFMSVGIKIILHDMDVYDAILSYLSSDNTFKYYTFNVPHKQPYKVVLYGLPKTDINDINELKNILPKHLVCEEIKEMSPKISKYNDYAIYIAYFNRDNFNLKELQKSACYVMHIKVRWEHFRRRSGPTQCSNCQLFGHGSNNCHLDTKCNICGGPHEMKNCEHYTDYSEGYRSQIKCSNCGENHLSNSSNCPKREEFINIRRTLALKANSSHRLRTTPQHNKNLDFNDRSIYPPLSTKSQVRPTLSDQIKLLTQQQQLATPPSLTSVKNRETSDEQLFSVNELLNITKELISSLRKCKDKYDQLQVITELAVKYVYGNGQN